eukprot:TRINITY_DN703_c0_g1_i1.p1 TRINITY_DN703_c0_g1~~TRINITY_DN703_c0_g1_i1.p1  ORF type:complete len:471 (-),score=118.13 TRINITY_DN703_c0_g1_i1:34-1446(-)
MSLKVRRLIRTSSGSDTDSSGSKNNNATTTKLESLFKRKSSLSKEPQLTPTSPRENSSSSFFRRKSSSKDFTADKTPLSPLASPDHSRTPSSGTYSPARIPVSAAETDAPVRGSSMSAYSLFHVRTPPTLTAPSSAAAASKPKSNLFNYSASVSRDSWGSPPAAAQAQAVADPSKRSTAFPSKVFIPAVKPLEIIDDIDGSGVRRATVGSSAGKNTAGANASTNKAPNFRLFTVVGYPPQDADQEQSISTSFAGGSAGGGGGGGSVSSDKAPGGQRRTASGSTAGLTLLNASTTMRGAANESGSMADNADVEAETPSLHTTSQYEYEDELKTNAGDAALWMEEALSSGGAGGSGSYAGSYAGRYDSSETVNGVCKHFLRGKCRFREKCRNSHAIDNCVHCNAKLPKSRLAASAHLSKCYKSKYGGGATSQSSSSLTPSSTAHAFRTHSAERMESDDNDGEVSLFEALRLQ